MNTDYRLTCRHCGERYLETVQLLFHRCPAQNDAQKARRNADCLPERQKVRTPERRRTPASEGAA